MYWKKKKKKKKRKMEQNQTEPNLLCLNKFS